MLAASVVVALSTIVRPGDLLFVLALRSMRRDVDDVFERSRHRV